MTVTKSIGRRKEVRSGHAEMLDKTLEHQNVWHQQTKTPERHHAARVLYYL
jgi:hypothetical protein